MSAHLTWRALDEAGEARTVGVSQKTIHRRTSFFLRLVILEMSLPAPSSRPGMNLAIERPRMFREPMSYGTRPARWVLNMHVEQLRNCNRAAK